MMELIKTYTIKRHRGSDAGIGNNDGPYVADLAAQASATAMIDVATRIITNIVGMCRFTAEARGCEMFAQYPANIPCAVPLQS